MATALFPLVKGIEYDEVLVSHAIPCFLDLFHCGKGILKSAVGKYKTLCNFNRFQH